MSNSRILVCPVDRRADRADFGSLQSNNISYFVNPGGRPANSDSIVSGDANLVGGLFVPGMGQRLAWNGERHRFAGNVLFGDAHVEQWNNFAASAGGERPGNPPGVSVPRPPPYISPTPGGGYKEGPKHDPPKHGSPRQPTPGAAGGGRGVFTQLDEVAKRYERRPSPAVIATQAFSVPKTQAPPRASTRVITNAPPVVALIPPPSLTDPWPQRLSDHLTRTGYWPVYVLVLLVLALLLAFELLRRHRTRRTKRRYSRGA